MSETRFKRIVDSVVSDAEKTEKALSTFKYKLTELNPNNSAMGATTLTNTIEYMKDLVHDAPIRNQYGESKYFDYSPENMNPAKKYYNPADPNGELLQGKNLPYRKGIDFESSIIPSIGLISSLCTVNNALYKRPSGDTSYMTYALLSTGAIVTYSSDRIGVTDDRVDTTVLESFDTSACQLFVVGDELICDDYKVCISVKTGTDAYAVYSFDENYVVEYNEELTNNCDKTFLKMMNMAKNLDLKYYPMADPTKIVGAILHIIAFGHGENQYIALAPNTPSVLTEVEVDKYDELINNIEVIPGDIPCIVRINGSVDNDSSGPAIQLLPINVRTNSITGVYEYYSEDMLSYFDLNSRIYFKFFNDRIYLYGLNSIIDITEDGMETFLSADMTFITEMIDIDGSLMIFDTKHRRLLYDVALTHPDDFENVISRVTFFTDSTYSDNVNGAIVIPFDEITGRDDLYPKEVIIISRSDPFVRYHYIKKNSEVLPPMKLPILKLLNGFQISHLMYDNEKIYNMMVYRDTGGNIILRNDDNMYLSGFSKDSNTFYFPYEDAFYGDAFDMYIISTTNPEFSDLPQINTITDNIVSVASGSNFPALTNSPTDSAFVHEYSNLLSSGLQSASVSNSSYNLTGKTVINDIIAYEGPYSTIYIMVGSNSNLSHPLIIVTTDPQNRVGDIVATSYYSGGSEYNLKSIDYDDNLIVAVGSYKDANGILKPMIFYNDISKTDYNLSEWSAVSLGHASLFTEDCELNSVCRYKGYHIAVGYRVIDGIKNVYIIYGDTNGMNWSNSNVTNESFSYSYNSELTDITTDGNGWIACGSSYTSENYCHSIILYTRSLKDFTVSDWRQNYDMTNSILGLSNTQELSLSSMMYRYGLYIAVGSILINGVYNPVVLYSDDVNGLWTYHMNVKNSTYGLTADTKLSKITCDDYGVVMAVGSTRISGRWNPFVIVAGDVTKEWVRNEAMTVGNLSINVNHCYVLSAINAYNALRDTRQNIFVGYTDNNEELSGSSSPLCITNIVSDNILGTAERMMTNIVDSRWNNRAYFVTQENDRIEYLSRFCILKVT